MRSKLLYLIVISTLLISTLPAAIPAVAQETNTYYKVSPNTGFPEADEEPSEPLCGYIPPTMDLSHLREIPVNRMRMLGAFPGDWDWRTQGKVTPVKDQAPCSTCWIFGTTSVLESAVLLGEGTSYDFSEQSVALCVDRSWVYLYKDTDDPCTCLGNSFRASEVFIKKGAVLESCNPYSGPGLNCDGSCVCDSCPPVKKVTGFRYVTDNASDIELIKLAVYDRPVMMAYYHNSAAEYHDATYGPIYDFYPCGEDPNHLVSIIGWNDDVPHPDADHSGTGAWLVKNSWGTADSWAGGAGVSNGYFWLAYESSSTSGIAYLEYGDYDANEQLYYWDEVGLIDAIGVDDPTAWMASVFTSQQDGNLTHVDFWTTSNNAEYIIYIYDDSDLSDGLQNPLTSPQSGTCAEFGYYSIPLTSPVAMTNGQQFTVAVKMTTPSFNGPIAVEEIISGRCEPPIQAGVCFLSGDGVAWDDALLALGGCNVCLRARITSTPPTTGSISGYVFESDNVTPIEGATVSAWDWTGIYPTIITPDAQDTTDDTGYYSITDLPPGDYKVAAFAADHERLFYPDYNRPHLGDPVTVIAGQDTYPIYFALDPGGTISGTVTAQDGGTFLAQVSVAAGRPNTQGAFSIALTDVNGQYTLDGLSYGTYQVTAPTWGKPGIGDDGYIVEFWEEKVAFVGYDPVTVDSVTNPTGIDFTLELGGTISGHVEDGEGDPVALNPLYIWDYNSLQGNWLIRSAAITDANGDYESTGLPAGFYAVQARCGGYAWEWYNGSNGTYYKDEAASVEVGIPGSNTPNINFVLEPGGSISGHVEDSLHSPIPNLHVYAIDSSNDKWIAGENTDASGDYLLDGLPGGGYKVRACASCGGMVYADEWYNNVYSQSAAWTVPVNANENTPDISFTLDTGGSMSGTVKNADGSVTLADVSVECKRTIDGDRDWRGITTDSSGNYTFRGLPYGDYVVRSPGGSMWGAGDDNYVREYYDNKANEEEADTVTVNDVTNPTGIDFTLGVGGSISGHAEDSLSNPIVNLHVYAVDNVTGAWMGGTNTDVNGDYVLAGLPGGSFNVGTCAWCSGLSYCDEWFDNVYNRDYAADVPVIVNENTPNINFYLDLPSDLIVSDKWEVWEEQGVSYKVYFTVKNIGSGTAPAGHDIRLYPEQSPQESKEVPVALGPDESWSGSFDTVLTLSDGWDFVSVNADGNWEISEENELNNSRLNTIAWPAAPDLVIQHKYEEWVDDDTYIVHFNVYNQGNAATLTSSNVSLNVDGAPWDSLEVPVLAPGESYNGDFTNSVVIIDDYDTVIVCADSNDEIDESVEFNNCQENTYAEPPAPDLVVLFKNENWVDQDTYTVSIMLQNIGNAATPETGFDISLTVDGQVIETMGLPWSMVPGQTCYVSFAAEIDLNGITDEITVCVDANGDVAESREDNNCQTNKFPDIDVVVSINAPDYVPEDIDFTATVDINYVESLDAYNYTVTYDPSVLDIDDVDGVTNGEIDGTTIPVDMWYESTPGTFTVVGNLGGFTGVTGSGYLGVLHFHVIGSLGDSSDIDLSNGTLSNGSAEDIPAIWLGDFVEISVIPGDANGNGEVNAVDITKTERIIVGLDDPTPGADANQNGEINAVDITKIERIIVGLD